MNEKIDRTLRALGLSPAYKGYEYIRFAVAALIADRTLEKGVAVRIYPMIAEKYGTNVKSVDQAISKAIQAGWNYVSPAQRAVFGSLWANNRKKPTNKYFIVSVANYVDVQKL